jgi:hypothetical protein
MDMSAGEGLGIIIPLLVPRPAIVPRARGYIYAPSPSSSAFPTIMPSGYLPRLLLVLLPLTIAFGIIGSSVGLNALIKSNRDKAHFKKIVPPPVTHVIIDTRDITDAGIVLTVGCALLALSANAALETVSPIFTKGVGAKAKRLVSWAVAGCTVWILVCEIAFTVLFATRGPKVRAFVGSMELPQSAVQASEKALGATTLYSQLFYRALFPLCPRVEAC